jgi:ribosome-associated protein
MNRSEATQGELPGDWIELGRGVRIAPSELRYSFSSSSGPGGQAVNKLNTRAELRVALHSIVGLDLDAMQRLRRMAGQRLTRHDEIVIHAQTHRSQLDNKLECLARLRALVGGAAKKPKVRRKTKPSRSMIQKRLNAKRRTGEKKKLRRTRGDLE